MDLLNEAADAVAKIDPSQLTIDQRLKLAETKALVSIARELTLLREQGDSRAWGGHRPER